MRFMAAAGLLASALFSTQVVATCESFGLDFQNGDNYFQNISSIADFTFVQYFEGCDNDVAYNTLYAPSGQQYTCSTTSLQPDDTPLTSTCNIAKDEMYSGEWSISIISNNGEDAPIDYERSFYLTVGVPVTTTVTPTVTLSVTSTPIVNVTTVSTETDTVIVNSTVTSASKTFTPTVTVTPRKVTAYTTHTMGTISKEKYTLQATVVTKTHMATCSLPQRPSSCDPTGTRTPSALLSLLSSSTSSSKGASSSSHSITSSVSSSSHSSSSSVSSSSSAAAVAQVFRRAEIKERKPKRRSLAKRAPDSATVTVTDTNTADFTTVTSTSTAAATTMTITSVTDVTVTTVSTTTLYTGKSVAAPVTVTAPTQTTTKNVFTVITSIIGTMTQTHTVTVTSTSVNAAAKTICSEMGGAMV